jgi:hypothetical protein
MMLLQDFEYIWIVPVVIGAAVLGLALAYGVLRGRTRTRAEYQAAEDAAHDIYKSEDPGYDRR